MGGQNIRENRSGIYDPTATEAIRNVSEEECRDEETRFKKLLDTIFNLCDLAGFHIEGRIVIKSKRTGKIWR